MRKKEEKPITSYKEYKRRLFWVNFIKISAIVLFSKLYCLISELTKHIHEYLFIFK